MNNKCVIVTGGAKGIGKEICYTFAKNHYNVLINYNTSYDDANILKDELMNLYKDIKVEIFKCDVSKRNEVDSMIDFAISNFKKIDVLVNNAGISKTKLFNDVTEKEFKEALDINLIGSFNVTQQVLNKCMINNKNGCIINISSIWGVTGGSMETVYSATKSAIIGMSKALAKELGPSNIRVNVVAPGFIDTDMTKEYSIDERNMFIEEVPLKRIGNVKDVASIVYFLATDEASYITGQIISPNGGYLI